MKTLHTIADELAAHALACIALAGLLLIAAAARIAGRS